jgi:hypothetical protein
MTDVVLNYSQSFMLLEDLQPIGFARITIISCQFVYLYNLIGFTLYKENKSELLIWELFLFSIEVGKAAGLTGPVNRDGVPLSGEKSPAGPKGRIGSTDESRRRGAEASRMREVVLLDFPWERELPLEG